MSSDYSSVLRLLAEKLGMTPAEFDDATIVIEKGEIRVEPVVDPEPTPEKGSK